jgi:pyridoxal phosphate enzyme (YggS family)
MSDALINRYHAVQNRIASACMQAQRPENAVRLLAVSKFHSSNDIHALAVAGQKCFGENYVQELMTKAESLYADDIQWHFIGPLQSNKCKEVASTAFMIHSLDRIKLVAPLAKFRPDHLAPLQVLLQVNIDDENSKSGVHTFEELLLLANEVVAQPKLDLRGLMTIPAPCTVPSEQARPFEKLRQWRDRLAAELNILLPELSMGMSADLEVAIAEGATIVRVGTDIFGARPTQLHSTLESSHDS